ncbi:hypothetical protein RI578_27930 [Streptomyces sp. BB1-1-1]|uniref:hypothetical protein n=1 Tax=Streptomyces sp. BB1-1-1 TaxID=3074430 RepID=UPI00287772B7|nr:hypothetical protein [Streptomyces sp. BB1-1-1]WND37877.1 hypothetical protein RI578_27930 [Streptomyces sp. BB1-1-1]
MLVAVVLVVVPLLAAGAGAAAFLRVVRRGRVAQRLLEAWSKLDRLWVWSARAR